MSTYPTNPNVVQYANLVKVLKPHSMPLSFALAQMDLESGGQPNVLTQGAQPCSGNGGRGLYQPTPLFYYKEFGYPDCESFDYDLKDPAFNVYVWAEIMQGLLDNSDLVTALEKYNQGPNWNGGNFDYLNAILLRVPAYESYS